MKEYESKFYFGDRVLLKDNGVGRVTSIMARTNNMTGNTHYRYEVTFDPGHVVDWYNEDELELYVEPTCESLSNVVRDFATRPCLYLEEKATFHRWVDETRLIMKFDVVLPMKDMWKLKHAYEDIGVIPGGADAIPLTTTFALIELKDGSVKKVPPEEIRFVTEE